MNALINKLNQFFELATDLEQLINDDDNFYELLEEYGESIDEFEFPDEFYKFIYDTANYSSYAMAKFKFIKEFLEGKNGN